MISRGFAIEYFIEGGRSRSGRMMAPRTGLLGMTVRSYLRDHSRPLVFVPVYIGYEKLIEGSSFVSELEGKPKRNESLWGLLGMVRRLHRDFGRVHVNFGRPLALGELLDVVRPGWSVEPNIDLASDWVRDAVRAAAEDVTRRINDAVVVNPINLVALVVLATRKHCIDEGGLQRSIEHYRALLAQAAPGHDAIPYPRESAQEIVGYALRLGAIERVPHVLGDLLRVPAEQAAQLAYFRNNVVHLFALPAVIACLVSHNPCIERRRFNAAVAGIYGLLRAELFLHWQPHELASALDATLAVLLARGLIRSLDGNLAAAEANSQEWAELRLIGETIRPTLERNFLILALLQHHGSGQLCRGDLEQAGHLLGQRLALLYEFNASEFSERASFSSVAGNLIDSGLLMEAENGMLHFDERISEPAEHTELLLPAELRQAVRRIAAGEDLVAL
jgi:glycerol-3-phosphate O-acyltransferase